MTDEQIELLHQITNLDAFCFAILDDNNVLSGRQVAQIATARNLWGLVTKTTGTNIRNAWVDARRGVRAQMSAPGAEAEATPEPEDLIARVEGMLESAVATGDARTLEGVTRALKVLKDIVTKKPAAANTEDWQRLTPNERDAITMLTDKLNGRPLTDDGLWWVAFLASAPPPPVHTHPAHAPLPPTARTPLLGIPAPALTAAETVPK
jgi:hypothetical protein